MKRFTQKHANEEQAVRQFLSTYLNRKDHQNQNRMLTDIGEYYSAKSVCLFELNRNHSQAFRISEWNRDSLNHRYSYLSSECVTDIVKMFEEQEEFYIDSSFEDHRILKAFGCESVMAAAVIVDEQIAGFLCVIEPHVNTDSFLYLSVTASVSYANVNSIDVEEGIEENRYNSIISSLSSIFSAMYYINLEENTFQELVSVDEFHHKLGEKGNAREALERLCDELVDDAYQSLIRRFMDFDTIDQRLGSKSIIIQEYIARIGGWTRCAFIPVEKGEHGEIRTVLCTFRWVTAEKQQVETQDNLIQALAIPFENIYGSSNIVVGQFLL